jgi:hypothetical protein
VLLVVVLLLIAGGVAARAAMPSMIRRYVQGVLDRNPLYAGEIGDIDVYLLRGAYAIKDVRIDKTIGNVPAPLFSAPRVELALQWDALREGELVGRVYFKQPQINFVDGETDTDDQTGAEAPWLAVIRDLYPLRINSAVVEDGSVHFRAYGADPPVDVYLTQVNGTLENLTNIHDETAVLIATVDGTAVAMDHAQVEFKMQLDPFSYHPTFELAVKLLALDVTKTNDLTRAYGQFDFESGWFDLVIELHAVNGELDGYIKPMYRDVKVLSLADVREDNVIEVFWEALVGIVAEAFQNQPRDQFATKIPLSGDLTAPKPDILQSVGNVLRNAFIRAYMPTLEPDSPLIESGLQFEPGSIIDPQTP